MTFETLDKLASELYDYSCAMRKDNRGKNGEPGDPRKIECPWDKLMEPSKEFYRNAVRWSEFTMNEKNNTKKVGDTPETCLNPEHNPPSHIVLVPGIYEHTCPDCGKKTTFTIPKITC